MKKFFFVLAVFTAIVSIVSCGGDDGGSSSDGYSGGGNYSECYSGDRKCSGSYSYYCYSGYWESDEYCSNGCNSSTGRCNSSSGGSSGGSGSTECYSGEYECDGNYSYYCSGGYWEYYEYCSNGCNYSTGKCKTSSSGGSSGGSSSECSYGQYKCEVDSLYKCKSGYWEYEEFCRSGCNSSTGKCNPECSNGEYQCSYNVSQRCSNGKWIDDKECINSGVTCNDATGKCRTKDEVSPCPPKLSGSVSGSSVKLSWSYSTSSGCGTPTTATLKYYDNDYGSWKEIKSASASSFTSYTLSVSTYGYYDGQYSGQTLLKAGILVENEVGEASAQCWCFIDDKNCTCG